MTNAPDCLTVLTTIGIAAVKTYTRRSDGEIKVEGYGRAKTFTADEITIDERGKWLRRLAKESESFVVMGQPVNWKPGERKRRLSSERDGDEPTLKDVPRSFMPIDYDHPGFAPIARIDDGETFAYEVLNELGLKGTQCVWHLTNSHGFDGKYRIRLWVLLKKPRTCAEMKEWAKQRWRHEDGCKVDLSVYKEAQPIYTGDPILVGVDDPVERRVGWIEGDALDLKAPKGSTAGSKKQSAQPDENVERLQVANLYIKRLKPGQHMIRCPWESDHTDATERDDDTFYFEPFYNGHDIPAFKCHHAHCESKRWSDVLDFLGVKDTVFSPVDEDDDTPAFVYVTRLKHFWDSRDGALIEPQSYDAEHGGAGSGRKLSPTQAFLASRKTIKAHMAEYLPGENRIVRRGKIRVLNMWVDKRVESDASVDADTFRHHVEWLIPDEVDRNHFIDWMAWCFQHPERKITWSPILYGPPGTGKTSVINVLAQCIGRDHVSEPTQSELEEKFTDYVYGKLLVAIHELRSADRFSVSERLKPIVANPTVSVRRMHTTGFSVKNVSNVIASTNHIESLPLEAEDRRWMLIQCRDEPNVRKREAHMSQLHRWLGKTGYAGIAAWLNDRDVSRFKPESEAPKTDLKGVVIEASQTELDRAVEICEVFDGEELVTSSAIYEFLEMNHCQLAIRRLGLIAAKRKWARLDGQKNRVRFMGPKVSLWSPTGSDARIEGVANMDSAMRNRLLTNLNTKLLDTTGKWKKEPKK
jgi:hypothetical protein